MPTPEISAVKKKQLEIDSCMRQAHNLRVWVVGGGFQYIQMFDEAGLSGARSLDDADLICFTGGEDVDPAMYGEEPMPGTYFNSRRDAEEKAIFEAAIAKQKPIIGICRGSQFSNVMCGGKLWQDVNNHAVRRGHAILDMKSGEERKDMTSTHHQMMIPGDGADILALACEATSKARHGTLEAREKPEMDDVEVVWYPDKLTLCFQPHPEFGHGECRDYFLELVDEYIIPAC